MNIGRPVREEPLLVPDHELMPEPAEVPADPVREPSPAEPVQR